MTSGEKRPYLTSVYTLCYREVNERWHISFTRLFTRLMAMSFLFTYKSKSKKVTIMATKLVYMDDFGVTTCEATVKAIQQTEDERTAVILDQTCFYPRGGGQDWDTGTIGDFIVEEVRLDPAGLVWHIGHGRAEEGKTVTCHVDEKRRADNTRLHSAGHVLDMAMSKLKPNWVPGKGAHYPYMSFVEYAGEEFEDDLLSKLQSHINQLLQAPTVNTIKFVSKDELSTYCRIVPENIPDNKPTRVVLYGDFGVPCGGTHVQRLSEIGKLEVTKIKHKKGTVKVSYRVEGIN